MAAYAEGLNILKNAEHRQGARTRRTRRRRRCAIPSTTSTTSTSPTSPSCGGAAASSPRGCSTSPRRPSPSDPGAREVRRPRLRLGRGPLDGRRRQRRGRAGARADGGALRAVRLARRWTSSRTRCCRPCASASAATWRRSERQRWQNARARTRSSSSAPPATSPTRRSSRPCRRWPAAASSTVPVVGVAKSGWTREQLVERARASVTEHGGLDDPRRSPKLAAQLRYVDGDYNDPTTFARLRAELGGAQRPAHYLAIPPSMFPTVVEQLDAGRLHRRTRGSSSRSRSAATSRRRAR